MGLLLTFVAFLCLYAQAFAHPGRVDSNCGHHVRATGEYHYHYDGRCKDQPAKNKMKSKSKKSAKPTKSVKTDQEDEAGTAEVDNNEEE